ncbi:MAG: DNA methyltransferase [Halobacteria archaeon]
MFEVFQKENIEKLKTTNPLFLHVVSSAVAEAGFEPRGTVVRIVRTLRGGFRPMGAEEEFEGVCSMPRACWEPWAVFRKPLERGLTLAENLRRYDAGALRRNPDGTPFTDVIISERTPETERNIAPHPTLKPQSFMRRIVWAALPTGKGQVLDTFCGAGSTLAAAASPGYDSTGLQVSKEYCAVAREPMPKLALLRVNPWRTKGNNGDIAGALKMFGMGLNRFSDKEGSEQGVQA